MTTNTQMPLDPMARETARILRDALRVNDISITKAADQINVSRQTLSAWINGHSPFPLLYAYGITEMCGMVLSDVLEEAREITKNEGWGHP